LPAGGGDGIVVVAFDTFIIRISAALWHHDMQFVIGAIVVYRDVLGQCFGSKVPQAPLWRSHSQEE